MNRQNGFATPVAIVNGWAALMLGGDARRDGGLRGQRADPHRCVLLRGQGPVRVCLPPDRRPVRGVRRRRRAVHRHPGSPTLDAFILVAALSGVLIALYRLELASRRLYWNDLTIVEQTRALSRENTESERLLLNILPAPIAGRLRDGADRIADEVPDVTVLFADIVGFTPMAQSPRHEAW